MKNSSPKGKVLNILSMIEGEGTCEVRGTRIKGRFGGDYLVEAIVDEHVVARARHRDWRKAYRMLEIEASRVCVL